MVAKAAGTLAKIKAKVVPNFTRVNLGYIRRYNDCLRKSTYATVELWAELAAFSTNIIFIQKNELQKTVGKICASKTALSIIQA